ncbi:hypothetical protein EDB81DRAFT_894960 [Dactylonectria macrodidyma]|uniref:Uncharacterized protein n=1 Tax=Dactylonectria macrodidyma TaxID=307937 RepID=A0A9P9CZZ7_9HYPO|nr:hypothetical protein EDB81DRAFT_894960 [Dactylonectria macrodidyma]
MHFVSFWSLVGLASVAKSCLLPDEGGPQLPHLAGRENETAVPYAATVPIGSVDRFNGGNIPPRGLGSQPARTIISSVMTPQEVESALRGLVKKFGIDLYTP